MNAMRHVLVSRGVMGCVAGNFLLKGLEQRKAISCTNSLRGYAWQRDAHPLSLEVLAKGDEQSKRSLLLWPGPRVVQHGVRKQRRLHANVHRCQFASAVRP